MKKGFTLIEVLVSALILTMGVTGMLFGFVASRNIIHKNSIRFNAATVGNRIFEEIQRRDNEDTVASYLLGQPNGTIVWGNSGYSNTDGSYKQQVFYLKFDASSMVNPSSLLGSATDLTLVKLRISWDDYYIDGDTENSITMQMITNEPG